MPRCGRGNGHCGTCCNHCIEFCLVGVTPRCGTWNGHCFVWVANIDLSSSVLNRTSSHIRGRCYLPMFLLSDGPLRVMYTDSFILLLSIWSSLSYYTEVVNCCSFTCDATVVIYRWEGLGMFFESLSKGPWGVKKQVAIPSTTATSGHSICHYSVFCIISQKIKKLWHLGFDNFLRSTFSSDLMKPCC